MYEIATVGKKRLDLLAVDLGLFDSRERAQRSIMAGQVMVDGLRADKPGTSVRCDAVVVVCGKPLLYVSRGGLKLEKALKVFSLDVDGCIAMDVGASTGGFTDCLLQKGAKKVYAVDVGYGQLAWQLRTDPRVINLERTNIRYLEISRIGESIDIITVDTAFISVTKFSSKLSEFLTDNGVIVLLIKPQFEAGPEKVGKKGVVRDAKTHADVISNVITHYSGERFTLVGLTYSPIKGQEGNIEFLASFRRSNCDTYRSSSEIKALIDATVESAHSNDFAENVASKV